MSNYTISETVKRGDWSIHLIEDSDGHLNIYVTNDKSENLYEIDNCVTTACAELEYRITTNEIEQAYRKEQGVEDE